MEGGPLILLLITVLWLIPIVIIVMVAHSRYRSYHYGWWGFFLGWVGCLIAVILIIVQRERNLGQRTQASNDRGL